ncbi:MAG: hypothetical protein ACREKL_12745, partial [Chthoniobacterales bacterium]
MNPRFIAAAFAVLIAGCCLGWWMRGGADASATAKALEEQRRALTGQSGIAAGKQLPLALSAANMTPAEFADALIRTLQNHDEHEASELAWQMVKGIPSEKLKAIAKLVCSGPTRDWDALTYVMNFWGRRDPEAALAYARTLSPASVSHSVEWVTIEGWASVNPEAAYAWADNLPAGTQREQCMQTIFVSLAKSDPDRAVDLMLKCDGARRLSAPVDEMFAALARRDPAHAAQRSEELPPGLMRLQAYDSVAREWASRDVQAALRWAKALPNADASRRSTSEVARKWADLDPNGLLAWMRKLPPVERTHMVDEVRFELASNDPSSAIPLIEMTTSFDKQDDILNTVANYWAGLDPKAAKQWAESQTDPAVRDVIYSGIVEALSAYNSSEATALAVKISDSTRREQACRSIASAWADRDPVAAAKWAEKLPAGDERQTAVESLVD